MPVREWIMSLPVADRRSIGEQIQTVEYGWPIGMPICRSITGHKGLWEVRIDLPGKRIGRVFFTIHGGRMMLLHGFLKTSQKTPKLHLELAIARMKGLK